MHRRYSQKMPKNTEQSYKYLFSKLNSKNNLLTDSEIQKLVDDINKQIIHARLVQSKIRATIYMISTFAAVIIFIPVIQNIISSMSASGFSAYFSLILSDSAYVASIWKEFSMSLIESFPIWSGAAIVAIALMFTYSLSKSLFYIKTLKTYRHA